jgi:tetratricopeptide (TPR) repeat protein
MRFISIFLLVISNISVGLTQEFEDVYKKGIEKLKQGNYTGAIKDLDEAIKANNQSAGAYQKRALAKRKIGNLQGAVADYTSAIRLNSNLADAYLGRAQTKIKVGEYESAIADYNTVLQYKPNHPKLTEVIYNRGLAKLKLKNYAEALTDFQTVLKNKPEHIKSYTNIAFIKYQQGQIRSACADWLRARDLGSERAKNNANKACQCCM